MVLNSLFTVLIMELGGNADMLALAEVRGCSSSASTRLSCRIKKKKRF